MRQSFLQWSEVRQSFLHRSGDAAPACDYNLWFLDRRPSHPSCQRSEVRQSFLQRSEDAGASVVSAVV